MKTPFSQLRTVGGNSSPQMAKHTAGSLLYPLPQSTGAQSGQPSAIQPVALPIFSIFSNSASPGSYPQHIKLGSPDEEPVWVASQRSVHQDVKTNSLQARGIFRLSKENIT